MHKNYFFYTHIANVQSINIQKKLHTREKNLCNGRKMKHIKKFLNAMMVKKMEVYIAWNVVRLLMPYKMLIYIDHMDIALKSTQQNE